MTDVFSFSEGDSPLLVSIPHDGRHLAPGQVDRMTQVGRALPDTDWHVRKLYDFAADLDASVIAANYSRYVVDLNRATDGLALYEDQVSSGLFPDKTFAGKDIYNSGETVSSQEQQQRISAYWRPYHERIATTLVKLRQKHGYALLWDAHSIAGEVPALFKGVLPDLSFGTNDGASCGAEIVASLIHSAEESDYSVVLNERFRGGFITRQYGAPGGGIHAIQLELTQRNYMDEKTLSYQNDRALKLADSIRNVMQTFMQAGKESLDTVANDYVEDRA
jgi:N-formylglutamate amidohydrolase